MRKILFSISVFILSFNSALFAQDKKPLYTDTISTKYQLGYLDYSEDFKMYFHPVIIKNGKQYPIPGFSGKGNAGILSISPNEAYIIIEDIRIGYLGGVGELHTDYKYAIIDVKEHKVVKGLLLITGEWNERNQFIEGGVIQFDGSQ